VRNAPLLARLRHEAPVFYYEGLGIWVLSKYQDVKYTSREPKLFSSRKGILLNDARCRSRSTGDCPRQGAHRPAASAMNSISA
jgi:cytochrome P450